MTDNGNKIDFTRYKPRLIEYLSTVCGTQAQNNVNFRCPLHDDGDTPDGQYEKSKIIGIGEKND